MILFPLLSVNIKKKYLRCGAYKIFQLQMQ